MWLVSTTRSAIRLDHIGPCDVTSDVEALPGEAGPGIVRAVQDGHDIHD